MDIKRRFGRHLIALRKEKGLSQEALAIKTGMSRSYLSKVESGKMSITIAQMERISNALDVEFSELTSFPNKCLQS